MKDYIRNIVAAIVISFVVEMTCATLLYVQGGMWAVLTGLFWTLFIGAIVGVVVTIVVVDGTIR